MRALPIVLLGLLLAACAIPGPSTLAPSPSATASAVSEFDTCLPDPGPLPSGLQGDPCPSAIAAVRTVVAPFDLLIAAIYLAPGTFDCGQLWPGVGSPILCPGVYTLPGTAMHGWAGFVGSAKVAAVSLYRNVPLKLATSAPPPPWQASLAAFEVPPAGWVMLLP